MGKKREMQGSAKGEFMVQWRVTGWVPTQSSCVPSPLAIHVTFCGQCDSIWCSGIDKGSPKSDWICFVASVLCAKLSIR